MTYRPLPIFDGTLASIAPRLAKARDELVGERRRACVRRKMLREAVAKRERLVAHRELQLIRAGAVRSRTAGRYVSERWSKLDQAKRELAYFARELEIAERAA